LLEPLFDKSNILTGAPPGTTSSYMTTHTIGTTAPHGHPSLRSRLHSCHAQEGGPRSPLKGHVVALGEKKNLTGWSVSINNNSVLPLETLQAVSEHATPQVPHLFWLMDQTATKSTIYINTINRTRMERKGIKVHPILR